MKRGMTIFWVFIGIVIVYLFFGTVKEGMSVSLDKKTSLDIKDPKSKSKKTSSKPPDSTPKPKNPETTFTPLPIPCNPSFKSIPGGAMETKCFS